MQSSRDVKSKGYVYVLQADNGLCKIGCTNNIEIRLAHFNTHSPVPVTVALAKRVEDNKRLEAYLHHVFSSKRKHGEWFILDGADLARLRNIVEIGIIPKWQESADTSPSAPSLEPTHGGRRKGAGRKPLDANQRTVRATVAFPESLHAYFVQLGNGNISEGIRKAGKYHMEMEGS